MTDTYERQQSLGLTIPKSVAVVGCGGVGSWVAILLAMAGVPELWLFDNDHVSEHNRNRLPVWPDMVGNRKSTAVMETICQLRPQCRIYDCAGFSPELADQLFEESTPFNWIIATTDTHVSRLMVKAWADGALVRYIEAAAEGEFGSCTGVPAEWATAAETQPGYASVPVWAGPAVVAAYLAVVHILHYTPCGDASYRIGWDDELRRLVVTGWNEPQLTNNDVPDEAATPQPGRWDDSGD